MKNSTKNSWLLSVGVVFGAVLAAVGALAPSSAPLSDGGIARVQVQYLFFAADRDPATTRI